MSNFPPCLWTYIRLLIYTINLNVLSHPWTVATLLKEYIVLIGFIQIDFDSNTTCVIVSLARALEFHLCFKSWSGNISTHGPYEPS